MEHTPLAADMQPSETLVLVNLNNVIAHAIRHSGHPQSRIILRMDELPEVHARATPLHRAFGLLLQYLLSGINESGKLYCYVKGLPEGISLLDHCRSAGFQVALHTNAAAPAEGQHLLLEEAGRCFNLSGIQLERQEMNNDGQVLVLQLQTQNHSKTIPFNT